MQDQIDAERSGADDKVTARRGPSVLARLARARLGLPSKLLVLTLLFVMLAEVLIFVPSIANYRTMWLSDRLTAAYLASLATEAVPGGDVPEGLRADLLRTAQVRAIALKRAGIRRLVLEDRMEQRTVGAHFDLRPPREGGAFARLGWRLTSIWDALAVYAGRGDRLIRVVGQASMPAGDFVEIVLPEQPLRSAMLQHALNILVLSIIISIITAALVYFALSSLLVRPMMRLSHNMEAFAANPEDASRIITPSDRQDEIGTAERELARMQEQLTHLLHQKSRLAALGLAVSKINHDLRNMLANAQLISDRLGTLPDPTVQRFTPKLIASLDRAIALCNDTLRFGRAEEATPKRDLVPLAPLVADVGDGLGLPRDERVGLRLDIPEGLRIDADRDHLYRILSNIVRNSAQAIETQEAGHGGTITIAARRTGTTVTIDITDDGPGVPAKARAHLFQAFQGSVRRGGTGLGLAIAHELVLAHGGTITLLESRVGARFRIAIQDRGPAGGRAGPS